MTLQELIPILLTAVATIVTGALVPWIMVLLAADRKKRQVDLAINTLKLQQLQADEAVGAAAQQIDVTPAVEVPEAATPRELAAVAVAAANERAAANRGRKALAVGMLVQPADGAQGMSPDTASIRVEAAVGRKKRGERIPSGSGGAGGDGGKGGKGGGGGSKTAEPGEGEEGDEGTEGEKPSK